MYKLIIFLSILLCASRLSAQLPAYQQLVKKASALHKQKEYRAAAASYAEAFKLSNDADYIDRYNAACSAALAQDKAQAFKWLHEIIGISYFNYEHLLADADFASLHEDKRWLPLLNRILRVKPALLKPAQLYTDFDLLTKALKEAHTGLYWYNSKPQFDSICMVQRAKIRPGLHALDFYSLLAPIVAFTKEGHTFLRPDQQTGAYLKYGARYFPFYVKILAGKVYLINDLYALKTKGMLLTQINGISIDSIMQRFMANEPADGFNTSSKYRWIEEQGNFNTYYARCYPQTEFFSISVTNPQTKERKDYSKIRAVSYADFRTAYAASLKEFPAMTYTLPAMLSTDTITKTATLTFNTFDAKQYRAAKLDFQVWVKAAFAQIKQQRMEHLIIDLRNNGGGKEGYEDYVLSYMISKDYAKYDYVQASAFSYSFYPYTDYKGDWMVLDSLMRLEHDLHQDGRILRKAGIEVHTAPQPDPYLGKVYVLTSGLTYSGGAEFTSLLKNYTKAVFIGEEVGGGYYGNTSGFRIVLKLPNSKLEIGIPLLKFAVHTPDQTVPFGHGIMPDYPVQPTIKQFLKNEDAEMMLTKELIAGKGIKSR